MPLEGVSNPASTRVSWPGGQRVGDEPVGRGDEAEARDGGRASAFGHIDDDAPVPATGTGPTRHVV